MKNTSITLGAMTLMGAFVLLLGSCTSSNSTTAATDEDSAATLQGSIVYFDLGRVFNEYDMANDLRSVVETKVGSINEEVTRRGNKLNKDMNAFQDKLNKGLLTQSVANTQAQKLEQQRNEFNTYASQKEQEILEEQQVMTNQILDAINTFVNEFNAEKKYAMILASQGDILSTPVVAADTTLDITDELLEGLNAAYVKSKNSSKSE